MDESRLMGGVRRALVAVGAVFGVALLSAGVASAAGAVQLKSRLGNWCLDGPNGNNTATMVNPCNESKSQLWNFNSAGQIESVAYPGACVSISNAADTTPVILDLSDQFEKPALEYPAQRPGHECARPLPQR
jgi:Ricin-type beta-trefoil lectin domain